MARNNERDVALIAKELGLEDNLLTPTGEGLKAKVNFLEKDINGVGKKVNGLEEEIKKLSQNKFPLKDPKAEKENTNEFSFKAVLGYGRKAWIVFRPILYALGVMMLYFVGKALGIDIPLIP